MHNALTGACVLYTLTAVNVGYIFLEKSARKRSKKFKALAELADKQATRWRFVLLPLLVVADCVSTLLTLQ